MTDLLLINLVAGLIRKFLPGKKTLIMALLFLIGGFYKLITNEELLSQLCVNLHICVSDSRWLGLLTIAISWVLAVLRKATEMNNDEVVAKLNSQIAVLENKLENAA